MTTCDYAGCRRPGTTRAACWLFCTPHLHAHRELMREDQEKRQRIAHVDGLLMPSFDLRPLLNALHRQPAHRPVEDVAV